MTDELEKWGGSCFALLTLDGELCFDTDRALIHDVGEHVLIELGSFDLTSGPTTKRLSVDCISEVLMQKKRKKRAT